MSDEEPKDNNPDQQQDDTAEDEWSAALKEKDEPEQVAGGLSPEEFMAEVQQAKLEPLTDTAISNENGPNIDVILDIPVTLSMDVGSTNISIRNLLQLNQGSVVELDRIAGEALDVLVNGTLIAHGEVVVVNEKFGIRLTDIISPSERIKKLA